MLEGSSHRVRGASRRDHDASHRSAGKDLLLGGSSRHSNDYDMEFGGEDGAIRAKEWRKFSRHELLVDDDDRATEILLCESSRPHMRAFHCSWFAFFIAFFIWFCIGPILPSIARDLQLSKTQIWNSSIAGVGSTIVMRFILGPLCDVYGARVLFAVLLCTCSVPAACTGLVGSATGLVVLRAMIGMVGGSFVMCQYWTSRMFAPKIVGSANAMVGGWGNLGAGVTHLVVGSALYPIMRHICGGNDSLAWRTVCIIPAVIGFITGIVIYRISDDTPRGNHTELWRHGQLARGSDCMTAWKSFCRASCMPTTWVLFVQYACCFGVELTMNNAAALYFVDAFGQSQEAAGAIASIFGWLNLFARALGGIFSDYGQAKFGMRGRLWAQTICLIGEGILVLVFANTDTLGGSIVTLVFFSLFVQAAEGTSYGIVPYVDTPRRNAVNTNTCLGSICGIVGAGGNVGAVGFGFAFRGMDYKSAFTVMGTSILMSSLLSVLITIPGHSRLLCCSDAFAFEDDETMTQKNGKNDAKQGTSQRGGDDSYRGDAARKP